MQEYVLICEDSTDGILTGVYEAYQFKKKMGIESHACIHLATKEPDMQRLFTEYDHIPADHTKAGKVTDGGRATDSSLSWSPLQLREESANSWSGLQLFSERWLQRFSITSATFLHQPHFIRYMEDNS